VSPAPRESGLELAVLELLGRLGWSIEHGPGIAPGEPRAERLDYREVVLAGRLRDAVVRLNPELPLDAVDDVVKTALRAESQVAESENWRAYRLLIEGVSGDYRDADGRLRSARARLIDFDRPERNDFLAVNQFTVLGRRERRPDVVLFVNGLPLVLMELKRPGDENPTLRGAFNQIQTYRADIPDLFTWNQVTMISDGIQARAGSFTAAGSITHRGRRSTGRISLRAGCRSTRCWSRACSGARCCLTSSATSSRRTARAGR
jgi:type I restriction enzyme, R subunit